MVKQWLSLTRPLHHPIHSSTSKGQSINKKTYFLILGNPWLLQKMHLEQIVVFKVVHFEVDLLHIYVGVLRQLRLA